MKPRRKCGWLPRTKTQASRLKFRSQDSRRKEQDSSTGIQMRQFPSLSEEISELGLKLGVTWKDSESAWTRTILTQVIFEAEFEGPTKK